MTRDYWTPEHEQRLRDLYADHPTEDIASELGRPVHKVLAKAWRMGLRKSRECIARIARARTGESHHSVAYRWQPGEEPWNKGVKGSIGHHPNTRATQFKPGAKPHTWVPVGSLRVKDGMLEIKYSDDKGSPSRRWRSYATNVWMQAHGPVAHIEPPTARDCPLRMPVDEGKTHNVGVEPVTPATEE